MSVNRLLRKLPGDGKPWNDQILRRENLNLNYCKASLSLQCFENINLRLQLLLSLKEIKENSEGNSEKKAIVA